MNRESLLEQHAETGREIERRLREKFSPITLELIDDSKSHAGHSGNVKNGGHYFLEITSENFVGLSSLQRQQAIFAELKDLMEQKVHALSMKCSAPDE